MFCHISEYVNLIIFEPVMNPAANRNTSFYKMNQIELYICEYILLSKMCELFTCIFKFQLHVQSELCFSVLVQISFNEFPVLTAITFPKKAM